MNVVLLAEFVAYNVFLPRLIHGCLAWCPERVCHVSPLQGQFRGEQLAYIAALACDTRIVFGDRPKDITYRSAVW